MAAVKIHNLVLSDASGTEVAWFDLVLAEGTADLSGETLSVSKLGEGIYSFEGSTGYVFVAQLSD